MNINSDDSIEMARDRTEMARAVRATPKIDQSLSTIDKMRYIVEHRQANRVDGLFVDMMTASVIVQIHDALSDANKIKFEALKVRRMADTAFKLTDRCKT